MTSDEHQENYEKLIEEARQGKYSPTLRWPEKSDTPSIEESSQTRDCLEERNRLKSKLKLDLEKALGLENNLVKDEVFRLCEEYASVHFHLDMQEQSLAIRIIEYYRDISQLFIYQEACNAGVADQYVLRW